MGSIGDGPICIPSVQSAATILQLETRLISGSCRHFQPTVRSTEGICESSVVSSCQSSLTGEEPANSSNSCGSSVEGAIVLSRLTGNAVQLPETTSMQTGDHSTVFRWSSCHSLLLTLSPAEILGYKPF